MSEPHLCLPMCVFLHRILGKILPTVTYRLALGSLHVIGNDYHAQSHLFDPRGPDGVDGGFHAWLEDTNGLVLDPSIFLTLADLGYDVDPTEYLLDAGRFFQQNGLTFLYEEVRELELVGVVESDAYLAELMDFALFGKPPRAPGKILLDIVWRMG